ncbi:RNA polymerase sigma factor [Brevibacillus laterosporus]|uniref:RNA polymerase sigma factor n=1 Tax=Brevibacillus laterosporus TaxID=1465 RepID=A0A0F6XYX5_BRELA|nr:RNA polymerase sigma factor [Brevibacillus laterosporus]AKF92786.1 RNA polymerase sigma-70 factor [Brevibacillus laterosporus]MDN9011774.1 RNA polymerase sigma factor [Brevibacillus laterosporus]MDO0942774.1 RNA polymerase sigma factor [Brevibacillus laterosporus]
MFEQEEQGSHEIREIYRLYAKEVYQYLYYFTGNRNDAEDLTQEVFLRVIKSLSRFEQRSSMKTWILHIARYVAIDEYRKNRLQTVFGGTLLKLLPSSVGLPEKELQDKEQRTHFEQAMLSLKPKYRNVIILRGIREYSVKETADILGCSEAKVKVDFHRAMKMLRESASNLYERGMV